MAKKHRSNPVVAARLAEAYVLIQRGVSIRKADEQTGVGRTTIRRHLARLTRVAERMRRHSGREAQIAHDAVTGELRVMQRCPGCGAMAFLPCLACKARGASPAVEGGR